MAVAAVLTFGTFACSAGTDQGNDEILSASEVCDSSLDEAAIAALKRLGETEQFTELPGKNDAGQSNKFSLKRSAATLYKDLRSLRNECMVFVAGDDSGPPLIWITFSAEKRATKRNNEPSTDSFYPIGAYAKSNGDGLALLYFKCSTQDPAREEEARSHIRAYLNSPAHVPASGTGHRVMTILNSVSRAMAKTLGCESEAALPSKIPAPLAR
jgi:hypothetical protein